MEIEVTKSEGGFEDAYTVVTSVKCNFCDFEETTSKKSTEGTGHIFHRDYFIGEQIRKSQKAEDSEKTESEDGF
jgi:hypothetical protein